METVSETGDSFERWGLRWQVWAPNAGVAEDCGDFLRLATDGASAAAYSDGQIDDYAAGGLRWRPPLTFAVRARLGADGGALRGTAGFGLWNDPGGTRTRRLSPPRALWFFYAAPPGRLALDSLAPGDGWMAMTFDAAPRRWLPLAPLAPLALLLMRVPWLGRALWPIGQAALGVRQVAVPGDCSRWRDYRIEWLADRTRFFVDGRLLLETPFSPRGPLGLVFWIDNQYAVVSPRGELRGGLLDAPGRQWLEIAGVKCAGIRTAPSGD